MARRGHGAAACGERTIPLDQVKSLVLVPLFATPLNGVLTKPITAERPELADWHMKNGRN